MPAYRIVFTIIVLLIALAGRAQNCSGSLGKAVWLETFGKGTNDDTGAPLSGDKTTLAYAPDICGGEEGTYTLMTQMGTSCKDGIWQSYNHDHTGDEHGYMMVINADRRPGVFYTQLIKGSELTAGTTYQLSAFVSNILRELPRTRGFIVPRLTFRIQNADGTLLTPDYTTPDITNTDAPGFFEHYNSCFTAPAGGTDVLISLLTAVPGGDGNDFAIDDISISPLGQAIPVGFGTAGNTKPKYGCSKEHVIYTLVSDISNYNNPDIQWQQRLNSEQGWADITGPEARQRNYVLNIPNAIPGTYQYRVGLLDASQRGRENNRIYSDALTLNITAAPLITLPATLKVCEGQPLQLAATGGSSYKWTGPNGYVSFENSPLVTQAAVASQSGRYDLEVGNEAGCTATGNIQVTVYPAAKISSISQGSTICAGDAVQLQVSAVNALSYKWSPAAGISNNTVASPIARPAVTTTYTIEVIAAGCNEVTDYRQVTVTVNQPPVAHAGSPLALFAGGHARLQGQAGGDYIRTYWTPADYLDDATSLTPLTSAPRDMQYTLHVAGTACGEQTSTVAVRVYQPLALPNSFTPNGDGINDVWMIGNLSTYPAAEVSIYNRLGRQVYYSRGYTKPWDGTLQGQALPTGSYYYLIDLHEKQLQPLSGWLMVVR